MLAWFVVTVQAASVPASPAPPPTAADAPRPAAVRVVTPCRASTDSDEVVVCGRGETLPDQRLHPADPRFEKPDNDGLLVLPIPGVGTLKGGGPKDSVGITLILPF